MLRADADSVAESDENEDSEELRDCSEDAEGRPEIDDILLALGDSVDMDDADTTLEKSALIDTCEDIDKLAEALLVDLAESVALDADGDRESRGDKDALLEPCGDFVELGDNDSRTLAEDEGDTERDARLDGDSRDADGDCVNDTNDVDDTVFFRCDGVRVAREANGDTDILAVTLPETDTRGDLEDETDTLGDDEYEKTVDKEAVRDAPPLLVGHAVTERVGVTEVDTDAIELRLIDKVSTVVNEFVGDSESVGIAERETTGVLDDSIDSVGEALEESSEVCFGDNVA